MTYAQIFAEYYVQFRGDSVVPGATDPEWSIGVMNGNSAIRRWGHIDAEEWDELWTTAVAQGFAQTWPGNVNGPVTATFTCPTNMQKPGGFVQLTDPVSGSFIHISVSKLQDVQFKTLSAPFAYFTGGEQKGYSVTINLPGTSNFGWIVNFPLYKSPTYFNAALNADGASVQETGTTVTEVPDSGYIISSMLAQRLFSTRNPFFQQSRKDADLALSAMQLKNGTGTPGNTWNLNDNNKTGSFGPGNTPAITNSGFGF